MIKKLLKNFSALAIGTMSSKILALLIVPIYTSVLSTTAIGEFDLINTIISISVPLMTLNVGEGVLRFLLDKKYDSKIVKRVGHKYIWISVVIFGTLTTIAGFIFQSRLSFAHVALIITLYLSDVWYNYYLREKRGENYFKGIAIAGILNTVIHFAVCCLLLLVFNYGIEGYALSYVVGNACGVAFLMIFCKKAEDKDQCASINEKDTERDLLAYSRPLVINAVSWWINDYSDRYVITWIKGIAESGIYSVAYKIPSILNVLQTIFNQVWVVATVQAEEEGNVDEVKRIYKLYKSVLFLGCATLLLLTKTIAHFLYAKDFFLAWQYTPYLITAIIYSSLSGCIGGILAAKKMTKLYAYSTFSGALLNIVMNIVLVKTVGTVGASIATLVSCFMVYFVRIVYLRCKCKILLNDLIQYAIAIPLFLQMITVSFEINYSVQIVLYTINLAMNGIVVYKFFKRG